MRVCHKEQYDEAIAGGCDDRYCAEAIVESRLIHCICLRR